MFSVVFCIICWLLATVLNLIATRFWFKVSRINGILSVMMTVVSFMMFLLYLFRFKKGVIY